METSMTVFGFQVFFKLWPVARGEVRGKPAT